MGVYSEKDEKQKRYKFRKQHEKDLQIAWENQRVTNLLYDELYSEIKDKALEGCFTEIISQHSF